MRRAIALFFLATAIGCSTVEEEPAPRPAPETRTALLSVGLERNGGVALHTIVVKPIDWNGTTVPYDPSIHEPPSGRAGWTPRVVDAPDLDSPLLGSGGDSTTRVVPDTHAHRGALVVAHPSRPSPSVVPLSWGQPGEGHGDVVDRWAEGAAIWRAPWYGEGTEYRVLRIHPGPSTELARGQR